LTRDYYYCPLNPLPRFQTSVKVWPKNKFQEQVIVE